MSKENKTIINLSNRTGNSMRNSFVGIGTQIFQTIASFLCRMVFVRCLSQEYLGVNGLFADVISILSVAELGIGTSVTFELYRALAENDKKLISALMDFYKKAYRIIGIVIAIAGCLLLPFIDKIINKNPAISESVYILYLLYLTETVVSYFFTYKLTIVQASQQNYIISVVEMAGGIIKNAVQIIILIRTHNFVIYLLVQIMFRILTNMILALEANKLFPMLKTRNKNQLPPSTKERMTENIRYVFINNLFGKLVNSTDTIIISALIGLSAAGVNSNYMLIISTTSMFTSKILDGITGSIGNINATETNERKIELFDMIYLAFYWILLWFACCFIGISSDVISIFFGMNYVMPISVVFIVGINFFQQQLFQAVSNYRSTLGLFKYGRYTTLATGIINIGASILLGKLFGIFGILAATFIARMLTLDWYYPYIVYKHGFHKNVGKYYLKTALYWLKAFLIIVVTYYLCSCQNFDLYGAVLYKALVCFTVPNLMIIFLNFKNPEFKALIKKLSTYLKSLRHAHQ